GLAAEAGEEAEHAEAADGAVEELRLLGATAPLEASRRQEELEVADVLAEGPGLPVVLPVHVHGRRAAGGREHGAGHDGGPPSVGDRVAPDLADRHPGLNAHHPLPAV